MAVDWGLLVVFDEQPIPMTSDGVSHSNQTARDYFHTEVGLWILVRLSSFVKTFPRRRELCLRG